VNLIVFAVEIILTVIQYNTDKLEARNQSALLFASESNVGESYTWRSCICAKCVGLIGVPFIQLSVLIPFFQSFIFLFDVFWIWDFVLSIFFAKFCLPKNISFVRPNFFPIGQMALCSYPVLLKGSKLV